MKIQKTIFKAVIQSLGYEVQEEFKFCPTRKFRADWKVSKGGKNCLVEYNGFNQQGISRHGTLVGQSKDCEKYNLATKLGYDYFIYTKLNFDDVINDLNEYFRGKE